MKILFYSISEEKRKLNKILGTSIELNGNLVGDTSLVSPTIEVGFNSNLSVCNYVYIQAFRRYYFITDITLKNKVMIIKLHCDVLMSFKNDILNSKATVIRTNTGNSYIPDNMIMQTKKIKRQAQKIGTGFTKSEKFVLQIGG